MAASAGTIFVSMHRAVSEFLKFRITDLYAIGA